MEELYAFIEEKVRESGYPGDIDGKELYDEISMEAENHDNGVYIFMVKRENDMFYEGNMEILDEQFDLHCIDIHSAGQVYHVDFDA